MKNIKVFLITFIIVILVGAGILVAVSTYQRASSHSKQTNGNDSDGVDIYNLDGTGEVINLKVEELVQKSIVDLWNRVVSEGGYKSQYDNEEIATETTIEQLMDDDSVKLQVANENHLVMSFAGDILFDPGYSVYASYITRGKSINACFSEELLNKMKSADIMMLNNEFPYSDRGTPQAEKTFTFRAPTESVHTLDELGVDLVSIANNHLYDYGEEAFLDSLDTLNGANIPYVGGGRNIEEASKPYIIEADGCKVAFIGATQIERTPNPDTKGATDTSPGVFRCYDPELLCETIRKTKEQCDLVVLYVHWGTESTDQLDWAQPSQAKQYTEAGADLIIGDHPHVLQELAYIEDTPIIYSLGNFWFNSKTLDTCLLTVDIDTVNKKIYSVQFEPCIQSGMSVSLLEGSEKTRVINYMRTISDSASIDDEGYVYPK